MSNIPATIDQVTPEWVAEVTGLDVTSVNPTVIGVGVGVSSSVYRLELEGVDVPAAIVLKLRAVDEAAVFTSSMLRMYEREVRFFDELAEEVPITVPRGFGGGIADDGATYFLFMEDMGGNRSIDQNVGMDIEDAERAVDALARWHASFWGKAQQHVDSGAALSIGDDVYRGVLPVVFAEGWAKVKAEIEVPPSVADVAPKWVEKLPDLLDTLSSGPTTVVHGDYRADNIFFDPNDELVLLDFQLTGAASGAYDLAYFVTQSLTPSVANEHETALLSRYRSGLLALGVPEADLGDLDERYRVGALFCLVYPIVASRGMDLADERQRGLVDAMLAGCARAIEALDLGDLL